MKYRQYQPHPEPTRHEARSPGLAELAWRPAYAAGVPRLRRDDAVLRRFDDGLRFAFGGRAEVGDKGPGFNFFLLFFILVASYPVSSPPRAYNYTILIYSSVHDVRLSLNCLNLAVIFSMLCATKNIVLADTFRRRQSIAQRFGVHQFPS
jgi:hypothetical protein